MGEVLPPERLRQRRQEVALRQVADREHVEEAVVRLRVGADDHPAAEGLAVRDDDVVHVADAGLAVDRQAELRVLPLREDRERRPEVGDLAAERLRRLVRALGDRAAHARARDVREVRRRRRCRPRPGSSRDRGRSSSSSPSRRRRWRRRACAGSCRCGRSPSRCRAGSRRSRRPRARRSRSRPRSRSRRRRRRRAASRRRPRRRGRGRRAGPAAPRRACRPRAPSSRRGAPSPAQRRPVDPFAEAGLTRKTVSLMSRGRGGEGHARHPVDGGLHLVVRHPLELALDDDVADDQQAAGLDAA